MPVVVRLRRDDEARTFLEIHPAAVRGLATRDYPASVIEEWAPLPVDGALALVVRTAALMQHLVERRLGEHHVAAALSEIARDLDVVHRMPEHEGDIASITADDGNVKEIRHCQKNATSE